MRTDDIKKVVTEGFFVIRPVDVPKISIESAHFDYLTGKVVWNYWHYPTTPGLNDEHFAEFPDKETRDIALNKMLKHPQFILD